MARLETRTCYHCDAAATGREHVPPKCLFPKEDDWSQLMTVPSCKAHNEATSKADEYLKFLLGAIASDIPETVRRSVARGTVRLAQKRSRNLHRFGFRWERDALAIDGTFLLEFELLSTSLKKMARALYFLHHAHRRKLLIDLAVWPLFIPVGPEADPKFSLLVEVFRVWADMKFKELPKSGTHQEIFAYQVIEEPTFVVVNMEFYGVHRASVAGMAK
ncbi:hypothetical protein VDQ16_21270 [Xanthomonas campestris pv. campestris]|uniref:hypothetical protein n=1 Tax=Xanthomonas campestris TaxID=339 RepID=UPI002B231FFB|nr:hypothetical protein [Xanthomonas campestris]MEB1262485.1 hypothetical protein [Xanthomonas campestris pv. campestris]MEA9913981.1 hypothetical protein [Xanthomonas campestris pv. raphani]MEB1324809.1 hypothetical protein [Xanthomonas campestris pv. campestris]MEB1358289.1 hypothetical protein [Xanthomonas campestris pv. campestris]MEB1424272.1 hypothetical protein [Xanthomonas campestris pv. campestris]